MVVTARVPTAMTAVMALVARKYPKRFIEISF
jgi:hypothetical protein